MPREQIYFPDPIHDPSWDKAAHRDARRALARKMRAHKAAMVAYGMAIIEAVTGERPRLVAPKRKSVAALHVDADSILDS